MNNSQTNEFSFEDCQRILYGKVFYCQQCGNTGTVEKFNGQEDKVTYVPCPECRSEYYE